MTEQITSLDPYYNLINACRSAATKRNYTTALNRFMSFLNLSPLDYDKLLAPDPLVITKSIVQWVIKMHERGLSSTTIAVNLAGIQLFYAINDVVLNWVKIKKYTPDPEKTVEDRPYTHSEIRKLLEHTSLRNRAIILLMCSSGCRVGAISGVRIKDLEPLDQHNIYRVIYYPKSPRYRYFSFCTPESRHELDKYLQWRRRWGERLTEESPLFRREYNPNLPESTIKPITDETIKVFMKTLLQETGLRQPSLEGKIKRQNVMMTHGFRKFFKTNAAKAGMDIEFSRRLMGQHGGGYMLEDAYNKISEEELLEGNSRHVGYISIIDQLTINEENRLKRENKELKQKQTDYSVLEGHIRELQKILGLSARA